jgi:hypothetical protein
MIFLLNALLNIEPRLSDCNLVVVDSHKQAPWIQYDNRQFKIDQHWLTYDDNHPKHEHSYCDELASDKNGNSDLFTCDHVVRMAWAYLIGTARHVGNIDIDTSRLREHTHVIVQQMPRQIRYTTNHAQDELVVSWTTRENHMNCAKFMRVTLHSEGYMSERDWTKELYHEKLTGNTFTSTIEQSINIPRLCMLLPCRTLHHWKRTCAFHWC